MEHGNALGALDILILGGTGEARALAAALCAQGHKVTTSLAGRTSAPLLPQGSVRVGGFGGASGLARYLQTERVDLLIDATHPFAAEISANAVTAAADTQIPILRIDRPRWHKPPDASWIPVPDMDAAAASLPPGATVLLTIGRQELTAFFPRTDCRFVARMIEVPAEIPAHWRIVTGQGPFSLAGEIALLKREAVTHLVSKHSGGGQTAAKIEAAAQLRIPVVMVERPVLPPAPTAPSVKEALVLIPQLFQSG